MCIFLLSFRLLKTVLAEAAVASPHSRSLKFMPHWICPSHGLYRPSDVCVSALCPLCVDGPMLMMHFWIFFTKCKPYNTSNMSSGIDILPQFKSASIFAYFFHLCIYDVWNIYLCTFSIVCIFNTFSSIFSINHQSVFIKQKKNRN